MDTYYFSYMGSVAREIDNNIIGCDLLAVEKGVPKHIVQTHSLCYLHLNVEV